MKKLFRICLYIFAIIGFALTMAYLAVNLGLTRTKGIIDNQHDYFKNQINDTTKQVASSTNAINDTWRQGPEWQTLKEAIIKDKADTQKAGKVAGIEPRLIVSALIVEQLRLFHSNRELFKTVFGPLKVLGNQSQFSWGVMGIKQDTAKAIEEHLKDEQSPWYLGPGFSHMLDYSATSTADDADKERFFRLTSEQTRYYSYLYAALYMRQIESQWQKAGFPINDRPDILATLYNIGFENSKPNANPQSGGAEIEIGQATYSFGSLANAFYKSDELLDF